MSWMLYSIALEPFLNQIRESICGFKYDSSYMSVKLSAYADDIVVLINDQVNINMLIG